MIFQLAAIIAGVLIGWIRKGTLTHLASVRLRWIGLLPVAYVLQYISTYYLHGISYEILVVFSYLGLIVFCILNIRVTGMAWALAGICSNFVVLSANHLRMPAYMEVIRRVAPNMVPKVEAGEIGKSIAMGPSTHLNFLGDIFTIQLGVTSLVSIGDLLFSVGLFLFIVAAMGGRERAKSMARDQVG